MRLDTSYRKRFVQEMDQATVSFRFLFKEAFNDEVSGHYMNVHKLYKCKYIKLCIVGLWIVQIGLHDIYNNIIAIVILF